MPRVILGVMASTALLSLIISNSTACAVMVAVALKMLKGAGSVPGQSNLGRAFMIGIAFSANIGSMGTPGNALTIALLRDLTDIHVSFLAWMAFALPVIAALIPLAWKSVTMVYPSRDQDPGPDFLPAGEGEAGIAQRRREAGGRHSGLRHQPLGYGAPH